MRRIVDIAMLSSILRNSDGARRTAGMLPDTLRLFIGLEHIGEILWDSEQSLAASADA